MPEHDSFDYAVIRVVPRVDREEFLNVGIVVYCRTRKYLAAKIDLDTSRLLAFAPMIDVDAVTRHLSAIPEICDGNVQAGPIASLPQSERFHWLVAPKSTIVQCSPVHSGLCSEPEAQIERLMDRMVR